MAEMSRTSQLLTPDVSREIERVYREVMEEYSLKFAAEITPIMVGRLSQLFQGISWSVNTDDITGRTSINIVLGNWRKT